MALQISIAILSTFLLGYLGLVIRDGVHVFGLGRFFFYRKLKPEHEALIAENYPFYNMLDDSNKKIFQHRVIRFMGEKEFVARNGVKITEEVKILVAACAIMVTFGMKRYMIESIEKIVIYPTQYYSEINGVDHLGEFNPLLKTIVFSWEDFLNGLQNKNNNKNLGIHEFAHSIYFNSLKFRDESSVLFTHGISQINELLVNKEFMTKLKTSGYLRKYAHTNKFEFFAVCLEHFIETPEQFKKEFPELFAIIKNMINFQN